MVLTHYAVRIGRLDRLILLEAGQAKRADVQGGGPAVDDEFGQELPDDRRHLEAVAAEAGGAVGSFQPRQAVEDGVPVGGDGVQGAVAAAAVTAVQGGVTAADPLADLRQPVAVGRLVVVVRIDRVVDLLAGQAAGVDHVAVRRLEVDPLDEVAVDRPAPRAVGRPAEEGHLRPARLHRQPQPQAAGQLRRPRAGREHHVPTGIPALVGLDADDPVLLDDDRLYLDALADVGPLAAGGVGVGGDDLYRLHVA